MAEGGKEWHQFLVDDAEMQLIHCLRDKDPEEENPSAERNEKLSCTVELFAYVGDRHVGDYPVIGTGIIANCAEVGAKIQRKLVSQEWIDGANARVDAHADAAEEQGHADEPSVQGADGEVLDEANPWEEVRSDIIPSYVQNVTFTIAKNDLTDDRRKEIEERFPGVMIKEAPNPKGVSGSNRSAKRQAAAESPIDKPYGVRNAVFELDKDASSKDEALQANLRRQYPWATITEPRVPTEPRALRERPSEASEVEHQLRDFLTFMADYPPNGLFNVDIPHIPVWNALSLPQKLRIAHARAIQVGRYGETRKPATRCVNCKRNNYACKVYRDDFIEKSNHIIDLGDGCQHCRLLGKKCDLPPHHSRSVNPLPAAGNRSDTGSPRIARAYSVDLSSEATVATPQASRQPSLVERTSRDRLPSIAHLPSGVFTKKNDIVDLGKQLGLNLPRPDVLWTIYHTWKNTGTMRSYSSIMDLQYYYLNLVYLNIMANAVQIPKLEYATLLQFQTTNFEQRQELPDINTAVISAFEHLPVDSPLCKWISIVFSYEWNTVEDGDYEKFLKKNIGLDPVALSKFLYGVAHERDPHTQGGIRAVHEKWCTVHNHVPGSPEDDDCMKAERACKYIVESSESFPDKIESTLSRSRKRSFEGSPGFKNAKKFRRNDAHQYGSRQHTRASVAMDNATERDGDDSADDAYFTGGDFEEDTSTRQQPRRGAERSENHAVTRTTRTATNDPPRRRGRLPKISRNMMASLLRSDHLDDLAEAEFDASSFCDDEHPESSGARAADTPQRDAQRSEEPGSGRRSARAKASRPPGYFRLHPSKREFGGTMWGGFKDG